MDGMINLSNKINKIFYFWIIKVLSYYTNIMKKNNTESKKDKCFEHIIISFQLFVWITLIEKPNRFW